MFINEVMLAPVITKEMPMLCSPFLTPPTLLTYLSCPQYLVTFHTSNSRLRVISMAVRSMTIIPITHFLFLSLNSNLALLFRSSISSKVEIQPNIPIMHMDSMPNVNTISSQLMLSSPIFCSFLLQFYNPFYLGHSM